MNQGCQNLRDFDTFHTTCFDTIQPQAVTKSIKADLENVKLSTQSKEGRNENGG